MPLSISGGNSKIIAVTAAYLNFMKAAGALEPSICSFMNDS